MINNGLTYSADPIYIMKYFSRKLVAILVLIIWLSSLGTTYAKADLSNAVTTLTSGNNTYIKFNNGILIQYGRITTTGQKERRVYMPISFKNDGYKVFYGIEAGADVVQTLYTLNKSTSSFYASGTFYDPYNGNKGFPSESFDWFAIGIWK